jgi:two-component system cell cycle response regulator
MEEMEKDKIEWEEKEMEKSEGEITISDISEILSSITSAEKRTMIPGRKCLIIDDSKFTREQIKKILCDNKLFAPEDIIEAVDGLEGFKKYIENLENLDLVLCDVQMRNLDGIKFVGMVRNFEEKINNEGKTYLYFLARITPIIIITATATKDEKFKALQLGAMDFILKPSQEITFEDFEREIIIRSKNHIFLKRSQEMLFQTSLKLRQASIIDPLTGVFNRRYINEILNQEISRVERKGGIISAMIIDLDDFKKINDTYGHIVGDNILVEFAERIKKLKRKYDYVVRYGGDEFLVILPETRIDGVESLFERLIGGFEQEPPMIGNSKITLRFSAGASFFPSPKTRTSEDLIRNADNALYEAKKSGKSCIKFFY